MMADIFTKDKVKLVKGMSVWLAPYFSNSDGVDDIQVFQEEHTVVDVINSHSVELCSKGKPHLTFYFYAKLIFADKKGAIEKRVLDLSEIMTSRETLLQSHIDTEEAEILKISIFQNKLMTQEL